MTDRFLLFDIVGQLFSSSEPIFFHLLISNMKRKKDINEIRNFNKRLMYILITLISTKFSNALEEDSAKLALWIEETFSVGKLLFSRTCDS